MSQICHFLSVDEKGDQLSQSAQDGGGSQDMGLSVPVGTGKVLGKLGDGHSLHEPLYLSFLICEIALMTSICKGGG